MTKKNLKPQQAAPVQREILLRETTRNSPFHPNTYLKKCQKSFSACQGARFAPTN